MVAGLRTIHHPRLLRAGGQDRQGCQPHGGKSTAAIAWLILPGSDIWVPLTVSSLASPAQSECTASHVLASGADFTSLSLLWNYTLLSPFSSSWRETLPCQPLWGTLASVNTTPCTAETELEVILVKHRQGPPLWQPRTLGTATSLFRHGGCSAGVAALGALPSHL